MTRMRTIPQTIDYFKALDPESYINEWYLRGLVKSGALPCHKAGKRFLINLDALEDYLSNPPAELVEIPSYGKIRKISSGR